MYLWAWRDESPINVLAQDNNPRHAGHTSQMSGGKALANVSCHNIGIYEILSPRNTFVEGHKKISEKMCLMTLVLLQKLRKLFILRQFLYELRKCTTDIFYTSD